MLRAFRAEGVEALGSGLDDGLATLILAIEEPQGVSLQASPTVGADIFLFSLVVVYQCLYIGGTTILVSDGIQLEVQAPEPQIFVEPPGQGDNLGIEGRILNPYRFAIELVVLAEAACLGTLVAEDGEDRVEFNRLGKDIHAVFQIGPHHGGGGLREEGEAISSFILEGIHLLLHYIGTHTDAPGEKGCLLEEGGV